MTVAIVLAGGAGTRFGGDKLAAELDGRPLLHHALEAVAQVADEIVVAVGPASAAPGLPDALAGRTRTARDAVAHGGPLAGLAAGLEALAGPAAAAIPAGVRQAWPPVADHPPRIAIVVGGDMPGLAPAVLRLLVMRLEAHEDLAAITLEASPPSPLPMALRPALVREALAAALHGGRRSLRSLLEAVPCATVAAADWVALDPERRTLRDVDTRRDLERR